MAVLPQLWQMAMGPCVLAIIPVHQTEADGTPKTVLNVEQFHNFMSVIKKLGDRVEREHGQFLRDSQRLEDRSAVPVSGAASNPVGGEVNFENLVGRGDGMTVKPDTVINGSSKGWDEDDVWGSIFSNDETVGIFSFSCRFRCIHHFRTFQVATPTLSPPPVTQTTSLPSTPMVSSNLTIHPTPPSSSRNTLGAKPISPSSFSSSTLKPTSPTTLNSSIPTLRPPASNNLFSTPASTSSYSAPNYNLNMTQPLSQSGGSNGMIQPPSTQYGGGLSQPMQPMQPIRPSQSTQNTFAAPNYSISLPPSNPIPSFSAPPLQPSQPTPPPFFNAGMGVLAPSKPPQPTWGSGTTNKPNSNDWGDFDPLG